MNDPEIQKTAKVDKRTKAFKAQKAAVEQTISIDPDGYDDSEVGKQAEVQAAAARTQIRTAARTRSDGRVEVTGRDGERLSRTRTHVGDIFEVPPVMIPKGWTYQWNAISVAGNSDILLDQSHMMHQNGWRPVPAERYAGTLVPKGSVGTIVRGQQMLMERPEELTKEAQAEDLRNARQLISDRNESLKLTKVKDQLPDGMEMAGKYKGTGGGIRMQIDKSLDVLNVNREAGGYKLDE